MTDGFRKLLFLFLMVTGSISALAEPVPADGPAQIPEQSEEPDKCDLAPERDKFPEKLQSGTHEFSCRAVRWFDHVSWS